MQQDSMARFVKQFDEARLQRNFSRLIVLMVLVALVIGVFGHVAFEQHKQNVPFSAEKNLASIADPKANPIAPWRKERVDDAVILTENAKIISLFEGWLHAGTPANADRQWMLDRLGTMKRSPNYAGLSLLDPQGEARLFLDGEREVDLIAPLLIEDKCSVRAVGALCLEINPAQFLLPLIQPQPTEGQPAKTQWVRRQDDHSESSGKERRSGENRFFQWHRLPQPQGGKLHKPDLWHRWVHGVKDRQGRNFRPVRQIALWASAVTLLLLGASFAVFWVQMP